MVTVDPERDPRRRRQPGARPPAAGDRPPAESGPIITDPALDPRRVRGRTAERTEEVREIRHTLRTLAIPVGVALLGLVALLVSLIFFRPLPPSEPDPDLAVKVIEEMRGVPCGQPLPPFRSEDETFGEVVASYVSRVHGARPEAALWRASPGAGGSSWRLTVEFENRVGLDQQIAFTYDQQARTFRPENFNGFNLAETFPGSCIVFPRAS